MALDDMQPDGRSVGDAEEKRRAEAEAFLALVTAYRGVFSAEATKDMAQAVLDDLAVTTGFYRVMGPGASAEDRAFSDGLRYAFARVFNCLRMTPEEIHALEMRARKSALQAY